MKDLKFFPLLAIGILLNAYLIFIGAIEISKSIAAEDTTSAASNPIVLPLWTMPPAPAPVDGAPQEAREQALTFDVYYALDNCVACELMLKHLNTLPLTIRKGDVSIDDRALHRFLPLTDRKHPVIPVLEKDGLIESGYNPKSMLKFIKNMTPDIPKAPVVAPPAPPAAHTETPPEKEAGAPAQQPQQQPTAPVVKEAPATN